MDEKRKTNYAKGILIMLIIIAILVLIFLTRCERVSDVKVLAPTGNISVFDIDINSTCDNGNCVVTDKQGKFVADVSKFTEEVKYDSSESNTALVVEEEEEDELEGVEVSGEVYADDDKGRYVYYKKLDIFNNSAFEYTNKIAPGCSNVYQFVVHNSTNVNIKYKFDMTDTSDYKLYLKYRLKKGNTYIIGNNNKWVDAGELKSAYQKLLSGESDAYSLEWMWPYEGKQDNADTKAGRNMRSEYRLKIRLYFEGTK